MLAILAVLGFINMYNLRINMSVAIVCMVDDASVETGNDISAIMKSTEGNVTSFESVERIALDSSIQV